MRTEPVARLPAWLAVALACVGVTLGLWQVGAFDAPAAREQGAAGAALVGIAGSHAGPATSAPTSPAHHSISMLDDSATAGSATDIESSTLDLDADVRTETAALQQAIAEEQATDP